MQAGDAFDELLDDLVRSVQPNEYSMNVVEYILDPFNFLKCQKVHKLGETLPLQIGNF